MCSLPKVAPVAGACVGNQSTALVNRSSQIALCNASRDPSESSSAQDASKPQSRRRPRRLAVTTLTRGHETKIYETTLVPFSDTPAALCRARFHQVAHPHIGAALALPAKLMLIHSHGGTA
jgi:hypothetical protein